jgi:hypothetical protein
MSIHKDPHTFLSLQERAGADAIVALLYSFIQLYEELLCVLEQMQWCRNSSSSLQLHTAAHTPPHDGLRETKTSYPHH